MAFAVICKSCQARFLLNDDLLRRKVAGKVVTVRCRQCHATIEVDASDVDPRKLSEAERGSAPLAAPPPPPAPPAPEPLKAKGLRPAPAPPRPAAKSTLMGIGAPRPLGATELVALSPGLLSMGRAAQGFPEPPPPPGTVESLDSDDWEIAETPALAQVEAAPESVDDFEELPASIPPEDELPSSTGTPSLKALTHHDEHATEPRVDDFLANMNAAMNGGIMMGAPTIDVSHLAPAESNAGPDIDLSAFDVPLESKKTLPLFGVDDDAAVTPRPPIPKAASKTQPIAPAAAAPRTPLTESISPTAVERRPPTSQRSDEPRSRKNVVAPVTRSEPPAAPARQRSRLAGPLLVALAAAAGFLIWKRGAAPQAADPVARGEQVTPRGATPAEPPAPAPTVPPVEPAAVAPNTVAEPTEDLTFETAKAAPAAAPRDKPTSGGEPTAPVARPEPKLDAKPEPAAPIAKEEPKAEPSPAREPAAEPSGPFDRSAATAALTSSAARASACRKEGDPSGVASVVVTFAPSGRVTNANISGPPFAGTPTGGCIAAALRKARVPAFEGDRVTVSKTVVIQ
jgi:predicted Zn finger-like uncharacterized protein